MQDTPQQPNTAQASRPAKAFISYSWSSPGHQEQVRQWAERLISDGVEIVMDIFDLKEGHDKFSFMERMVVDPAVTHVLVVSDKTYAEKANARRAGVGTESQIISKEVYTKVEQTKFIPIVCEFAEDREPCLPIFMQSMVWIDFSSAEAANQNWVQLIRLLHGKPSHQKPKLGNLPAYITADQNILASALMGKLATFKHALLSNAKGLNLYREEFLGLCIEEADALSTRPPQESTTPLGQRVLDDCGKLKHIRNYVVDWVLLESNTSPDSEFCESLISHLGALRELKSHPKGATRWSDSWFEAHSIFVYETFLYVVAALLRTKSYTVLHEIFTSHYMRPQSERYNFHNFDDFGCFCGHSEALQAVLSSENRRFYSPAAELIKRQADRSDIPFSALMEAELVALLAALVTTQVRWDPQTLLYNSERDFPLFLRATQHRYFQGVATITGIQEADALRTAVKAGYERLGVNAWPSFVWANCSFWECMNMDRLDSLK